MREIKFRGKRIVKSKWFYGDLIHHGHKFFFAIPVINKFVYYSVEVIPETIGQFVGFKDKDGKDIYEGDICKMNTWKPKIITWREGRFWLGNSLVICCSFECERMKVLGNIYDNPELIRE